MKALRRKAKNQKKYLKAISSAEEEPLTEQEQTPEETAALFENGLIKIYNIEQLRAIGTDAPVMTNDMQEELFGTGEEILDGEEVVTYGADADYMLMNEFLGFGRDVDPPRGIYRNFCRSSYGRFGVI